MKTVEEARALILERIVPMPPESVLVPDALGRVLAQGVDSPVDSPRFDNSAMDGYAVRWSDVSGVADGSPVTLPVTMELPAGTAPTEPLRPGDAARIMTGGEVPNGADTVIMREDTTEGDRQVVVNALPRRGQGANIRRRASHFGANTAVLSEGAVVDAGTVGLLAALGICGVTARRRPRVAIVSTGDELVPLGQSPGAGQIVNSSAYMVDALVRTAGAVPVRTPIARDTVDACRDCFEAALASADMVVSIGGVSVGDYDVVADVMRSLDAEMGFWKIRMKPGKPVAFGTVGALPLFGLPGNPVSTFVTFFQFVWPAIRRAQGRPDVTLERLTATVATDMKSTPARDDFQRGTLRREAEGDLLFEPFVDQGSGNLMSMVASQALGLVPVGVSGLKRGDSIAVDRLPNAPWN